MPSRTLIYGILAGMAGSALPLILLPIVAYGGHSELLEELAKAAVIYGVIFAIERPTDRIAVGVCFGALFGISESMLYAGQIVQFGDIGPLWMRSISTVPMHVLTTLIVTTSGTAKRWLFVPGVLAAIGLHYAFNAMQIAI